MYGIEYGHELDFALGYIHIFPRGFKGNPEAKLFISDECPEDIRERIESLWPELKAETDRRHEKGLYTSADYYL